MTRLIDADALRKEIRELPNESTDYFYSDVIDREVVQALISEAPTVEEQRPHGEWEHWGSPFSDDTIANSIVCSLCKARYVEIDGEVFNFCPNCGADMREGDSDA